MKGNDDNWDKSQWQGRSREQVEGNYIVVSIALIGALLALAVGVLFS